MMLLAGCGRSVDSRLSLADSLIDEQADSAYVVLKGVNTDELTRSSDKAYYALLYTQAQYKNFDSIPNDSLINIALHHYSDNHNRELYTRALIYKGAVMQELGKEQEAMEWYKRAEDNASPDDYMNLGQANLRMSVLYTLNYADNDETLEKERRALYYFRKAESKRYELMCLGGLGGGYRQCNMDSAYYYLHQAITLAKELKDAYELYRTTAMLARAYNEDSLYAESKALSLDYLANNGTDHIDDNIYYDLAYSYAKIGMADSAQFYFDKTAEPIDEAMNVTRLITLAEINQTQGAYKDAFQNIQKTEYLSMDIISKGKDKSLSSIEADYDNEKNKNEKAKLEVKQDVLIISIIVILIVIVVLIYKYIERKQDHNEILLIIENLKKEKVNLENNCKLYGDFMDSHITLMKSLKDCFIKFSDNPVLFLKQYNKLIKEGEYDDKFWEQLYHNSSIQAKNKIDEIKEKHSNASVDDLRIILMLLNKFTNTEINICMGYRQVTRIYGKKKEIVAKFNIDCTLEEYLGVK